MSVLEIIRYYQTQNRCYIEALEEGYRLTPSGAVVHSTGANNPKISRYVGPDDGILGPNKYGNHWNKESANKCVHAWIGKVADGSLKIYQTLPWHYPCWGVGSGKKGSYNASHIQFEICEDGLEDAAYYREAFALAAKLCAYLCQEFGIAPENVVGHYEAHAAGYGSNHGDPKSWQRKHGGSMDSFRAEVAALAAGEKIEIQLIESPGASGAEQPNTETPGKAAGTAQDAPKVQGGVNMPTIRNGAQGTAVKVMQRLLMLQGAKLSGHGVDGKCGAETVAAVKAFQTAHNLSPDGICGPLTWAALAG